MKVIDKLNTFKTGNVFFNDKPLNFVNIDRKEFPINDSGPNRLIEYRTEARLGMTQLGSGNVNEIKLLQEQAAMAIAHELYGDVVERLHDMLIFLWQQGPRYDDKLVKMVNSLIDELTLK